MLLNQIFQPIEGELKKVEEVLESTLRGSKNKYIKKINRYLLESQGKMLRPGLVILSAKAASNRHLSSNNHHLIKVAASMELIHIASLIHDDVIDKASFRHKKPTINAKFGEDISIALGDYFYSLAFEIISNCGNTDIINCITSATKAMCEGELIQVCERDNLSLLKARYILIVKKKTAGLFAASCQAGAMISGARKSYEDALVQYGLNFGIAFQIIDDCLDLIGQTYNLGKPLGQDFKMGELTLPILNLLAQRKDRSRIISLIKDKNKPETFGEIRQRFVNSVAFKKTQHDTKVYINRAKESLNLLPYHSVKESLFSLSDYILERLK